MEWKAEQGDISRIHIAYSCSPSRPGLPCTFNEFVKEIFFKGKIPLIPNSNGYNGGFDYDRFFTPDATGRVPTVDDAARSLIRYQWSGRSMTMYTQFLYYGETPHAYYSSIMKNLGGMVQKCRQAADTAEKATPGSGARFLDQDILNRARASLNGITQERMADTGDFETRAVVADMENKFRELRGNIVKVQVPTPSGQSYDKISWTDTLNKVNPGGMAQPASKIRAWTAQLATSTRNYQLSAGGKTHSNSIRIVQTQYNRITSACLT